MLIFLSVLEQTDITLVLTQLPFCYICRLDTVLQSYRGRSLTLVIIKSFFPIGLLLSRSQWAKLAIKYVSINKKKWNKLCIYSGKKKKKGIKWIAEIRSSFRSAVKLLENFKREKSYYGLSWWKGSTESQRKRNYASSLLLYLYNCV